MTPMSIADISLEGLIKGEEDYRVLYKYQRITAHSLDALRSGYLYFSSFHQLNDPFDPFLTLIASQVGELIQAISDKGPKIFCATEDRYNPLMWAHYADSGAGMCVGYAVFTGNPRLFYPVKYLDDFVGSFSVLDLLTMKSRLWEWEAEWRACMPGDNQKFKDLAHPVSICLGPRCTTDHMHRVKNAMPKTVEDFDIIFPMIEKGTPSYVMYDTAEVVAEYGAIPTLERLFGAK